MPAVAALWMCHLWTWLGGALVWSGVLGLEPFGRGSGMGQSQLPLVPGLVLLGRSCKVGCSWLLFVLGLEVLERGYTATEAGCHFCHARYPLMGTTM